MEMWSRIVFGGNPDYLRRWNRKWNLFLPLLLWKNTFSVKYIENGERYDDNVNRSRIWLGNHPWAVDGHGDLWPWMILNRYRSRSQDFSITYLKYGEKHNVGHKIKFNEGQIGNRLCIGVNVTGDAGDASPAIFGQPGTKCLISPPPNFVKIVINCVENWCVAYTVQPAFAVYKHAKHRDSPRERVI